jgi:hypothetical protein
MRAELRVKERLKAHGRVLDVLDGGGTRLYLYDLSQAN